MTPWSVTSRGHAELHLRLRQSARDGFLLMKRFTHPVRIFLVSSSLQANLVSLELSRNPYVDPGA